MLIGYARLLYDAVSNGIYDADIGWLARHTDLSIEKEIPEGEKTD